MLIGLIIKDVVLIEALDLEVGPGLTVLTGETGAGKSIVLDALGLALGRRADVGLVRRGAAQAHASALFAPAPGHQAWAFLEERGFSVEAGEPIVLRRQLSADGRSRAFINDQPASAAVMREVGAMLVEVHGQHETVGLLDPKTHTPLLDGFGDVAPAAKAVREAWRGFSRALDEATVLKERSERSAKEADDQTARLAELDRLDPRAGEEASLGEERALLGAAEKALADISAARDALGGDQLSSRLAQAFRALERARDRTIQAGAAADAVAVKRLSAAADAVDRALAEGAEAVAAVDAAAEALDFEPDRLERTEERLFALRAAARKLGVGVDDLPAERLRLAQDLRGLETLGAELDAADAALAAARASYDAAAAELTAARKAAGSRLAEKVTAELLPLKLEKARFRVSLQSLAPGRAGAGGVELAAFEVSTNPGAPFGGIGAIASGGELARFALALKAALAERGDRLGPTMIFDEVDQGVGGAVADAVGLRLKSLADDAQVILVTHSPQIAARADVHWRVVKSADSETAATVIETLGGEAREEEIARMLAGAEITDAARAAARALMHA